MTKQKIEKLVPDTSVIIEGVLTQKLEKKEIEINELIIPEAVLAELEHQANQGRETGYIGIDELKKIQEIAKKHEFKIQFLGRRPTSAEVHHAKIGEIDALIRALAWETDATLLTADKIQAKISEARGIKTIFIPQTKIQRKIKIEEFFDEITMSAHLREKMKPMAKKGQPGEWKYVAIKDKEITQEEIKEISKEIIEESRIREDGFIEIEREGSTIIQLGKYRIVITRPPFSDAWEITAVRPIKQLNLEDYEMTEKARKRIEQKAEGILIAGAPGEGKSTFAQALAEYYSKQDKIVKTVEAPRDLVLPETITQLAISKGTPEEVHDILLLSRPDYTIFDEMRNTPDFALYADLRLAGVGMVGVVHATTPIDAIQRFIGRVELGVIPQIIDTVVFIKNGRIHQMLNIKMEVKVPSGMTEADLARPIVIIKEFETEKIIAEIYSYGEETIVVPIKETMNSEGGIKKLAVKQIEKALQRYSEDVKVEIIGENKVTIYVPEKYIANIIGKEGRNIAKIEEELGINIDVRELQEETKKQGNKVTYEITETSKHLEFNVSEAYIGKDININLEGEYLATFAVGKNSQIRIKKTNKLGKTLMNSIINKDNIELIC